MSDPLQIHLSKPGGQRVGPFTLEQINRDLAANKYRDTDYWAWHEGLADWVPLYALPGVSVKRSAPTPPSPPAAPVPAAPAAPPKAVSPAAPAAPATEEPAKEPTPPQPDVASGMGLSALEHIFVFTSGEGPMVWQSPMLVTMLEKIVGADLATIRQGIRRDVVGRCAASELLKPDGSISEAVWKAMAAHAPTLVEQAKERLYHVCVRTFRIEADTVVALVLFYNKQKLES